VAWKVPGADQYIIWSTDGSGSYLSTISGPSAISGSSTTLESFETVFHQDLNGDRVIGVPTTTVIESSGSTSLTQVGIGYYLDSISTGTGPQLKFGGAAVLAGQFGTIAPIGAEQTGSGYDVAWKVPGADQYIVWSTDGSGNYLSTISGPSAISGSSTTLESFETVFHQDLNGDGVIGVPASTSLAPAIVSSAPATFAGSTLILDTSSIFSGQIIGFAGDGTLLGSDQIDLRGMNYNSIYSTYDGATGILALNDGTNTTDLQFLGNYSPDSFKFADDGGGGSLVYAQVASGQPPLQGGTDATTIQVAGNNGSAAGQDTFVFAPNFGQATIARFAPETDTIQINKAVFANIDALLTATHDDSHGNAVITDAAHDTITIQNLTTAQLHVHQGDFHIV
jgi:hypothetical protein